MTFELRGAEEWIYGRLVADGTVVALGAGVYARSAPPGTVPPYLIYQYMGGHDVIALGSPIARVMVDGVYLVRAVGYEEEAATVASLAERIDVCLDGQAGTAAGVRVHGCRRDSPFELSSEDDGIEYLEMGGRYRLWVQGM